MSDGDSLSGASSLVSLADYGPPEAGHEPAPPNRAGQARVQALLRQLLARDGSDERHRVDTLRVLRKSLRELNFRLSWLTQVDLVETMERLLLDECQMLERATTDWRLVHDCTQLLIECWPRLAHELDQQTVESIVANVIQNLGHQRSEVRRASLLFLNTLLNERHHHHQPASFRHLLRLFIEHGLANHRNEQAQRGAILSLPLLMNEHTIEGQDLLPLVRCLAELLVEANEQLFYSLYLALQRLHLMLGDDRFNLYLRQCEPEATLLYRQAASRNSSMSQQAGSGGVAQRRRSSGEHSKAASPADQQARAQEGQPVDEPDPGPAEPQKQVTFENDAQRLARDQASGGAQQWAGELGDRAAASRRPSDSVSEPGEAQQRAEPQDTRPAEAHPSSGCSASSPGSTTDHHQQEPGAWPDSTGEPATGHQSDASLASSPDEQALQQRRDEPALDGAGCAQAGTKIGAKTGAGSGRQSSVSSTCSSDAHLVDPARYMNPAALHGKPLANYDIIHHIDHSNVASLAINDLGPVCNTPTMELGQAELKFGIFPRHLVSAALHSHYLDRVEAMQEMMCIIRESPINHLAILMTYFDSFLEQFLARIMQQGADYKLQLITIDMIETIVIKTKVSTMRYVRPIVSLLVKTLADSRAVLRDNTVRVLHKMMALLPPQHVIDAIFEHKHSRSVAVREECVNRVTAAVLEYDRNEFNLTRLCYHVLPMLADQHASVRLAALECIATLAHALGAERIGSLLTAAEAVQTGCDYDGLMDAIGARLMRRALPRCQPDGSIRYVLRPFVGAPNAQLHHQHQAPDVRWVLEAPSSHQHSGPYYHPHEHQTARHERHEHHEHHEHHQRLAGKEQRAHHRLGVYSPPDWTRRRRRSSPGLGLAIGGRPDDQHHHAHRHAPASPPVDR